jgi:Ca-activated chloride channel family protein
VEIQCKPGVRPVRVLGREAEVSGSKARVFLNQLYSLQREYVLLEIEVPGARAGKVRDIADVFVRYANLLTKTEDKISNSVAVRFSDSDDAIAEGTNKEVLAACVLQIATDTNRLAVSWRDEGKIKEAEELLYKNAEYLRSQSVQLDAPELRRYGRQQGIDAQNLAEEKWATQRKAMRENQLLNYKIRSKVPPSENAGN